MQVSTKKEDRRDFLNGLRNRLNVDEQTLSHLEMRMIGKFGFLPVSPRSICNQYLKTRGRLWQPAAVTATGRW